MPLDKEKLFPQEKYDCDLAMPCWGCGSLTSQRVKTNVDIGEALGEEASNLWAPICPKCLEELTKEVPNG